MCRTLDKESELQIFRTMDKVDKIGIDGVVDLLQKPLDEFGAGLMNWQALLVGELLSIKGKTNSAVISNMRQQFVRMETVRARFLLLATMENAGKLNKFLAMGTNEADTWSYNRRPKNLAFALDDIIALIQNKKVCIKGEWR